MVSQEGVIQTRELTKIYRARSGDTRALDQLTIQVNQGEIFGYLGPNGAGKTTTIRLLLDLIRPTSGSARIFGMDVREHSVEIHRRVGFLPGELSLWKNYTGRQVVQYIGRVRGLRDLKHAHELADRLKLDLGKKVRDYSSGNKRKLGLVVAMMHRPDLLVLDEPTSGLDPLMQQTFNQMMREIRAEGRTVFLSSHVLSEVQAICDRVGILRDGQLKAIESVERLTHVEFRQVKVELREQVPQQVHERLRQLNGATDVSVQDNTLQVKLRGDFDPLLRVFNGVYVKDLRVEDPTLEEIFLAFYGAEEAAQSTAHHRAKEVV